MSPNKNYQAGRRYEYETKAKWESQGQTVLRTAGSHGPFDLVAIRSGGGITLIQCKLAGSAAEQRQLLAKFRNNPPLLPSTHYHQCLECRVKGSSRVEQCFL